MNKKEIAMLTGVGLGLAAYVWMSNPKLQEAVIDILKDLETEQSKKPPCLFPEHLCPKKAKGK